MADKTIRKNKSLVKIFGNHLTKSLAKDQEKIAQDFENLENIHFINPKNFAASTTRRVLFFIGVLFQIPLIYSIGFGFFYYLLNMLWTDLLWWIILSILPVAFFLAVFEELEYSFLKPFKHLKKGNVQIQIGYSRREQDLFDLQIKTEKSEQFFRERLIYKDIFLERNKISYIFYGIVVYLLFFVATYLLLIFGGVSVFVIYATRWWGSFFFFTPLFNVILLGFRTTINFFGYSYDLD